MATPADNRSLGDLMAELSRETGRLVQKEIELATTELSGKKSATLPAASPLPLPAVRWSTPAC